jgi:hypothetical protein
MNSLILKPLDYTRRKIEYLAKYIKLPSVNTQADGKTQKLVPTKRFIEKSENL